MNKRVLIISAVVVFLIGAAGLFGAYTWYMAKPEPRGFVHSLEGVPEDQRVLAVEQCETVGHSDAILGTVVDAKDLVSKYEAPDRASAIKMLREKSTVELSGDKKGMIFMIKGLRKDKAFTEEVAKSFYIETLKSMMPQKDEF